MEHAKGLLRANRPGVHPHATMADVADRAGVSIKTVSRTVNGDAPVSELTRAKVTAAIKDLGYRPNLVARSLRAGADSTIGVIVDSVSDPFFAAIIGAVEDELDRHGYSVLAASSRNLADRERALVSRFLERRVSGCLVVPTHLSSLPAAYENVPVVLLDRLADGVDADAVVVEDRAATAHAVAHLIAHGHRRIAFLGDEPVLRTTTDRLAGFVEALGRAGIDPDPELVRTDAPTTVKAFESTKRLMALEEPPTALFVAGTRQAMGVVSAMSDDQRHRVAMVVFGDFPLADALEPGLTVIQHDPMALAREAVRLLIRRMDDPAADTLVVRQSLALVERGSGEVRP